MGVLFSHDGVVSVLNPSNMQVSRGARSFISAEMQKGFENAGRNVRR